MSNLSEEEKKAIEQVNVLIGLEEYNKLSYIENKAIQTILKLIDRLQKELDKEKEKNKEYEKQLDLDYVDKNFVSKDKIRKILKVYEKEHFIAKVDVEELLKEN